MTRYHPLLVTLHWVLAIMIIVALVMGGQVLAKTSNADPAKLFSLRAHMGLGMAMGALMVIRLLTRLATTAPPPVDTGNPALNKAGHWVHWLLYGLVFAMVGSGLALARMAGLPEIVFQGSGAPLPVDFSEYPPRAAHGLLSTLLAVTVLAHILAALWHQWIRRDNLMSRMKFGDRNT